MSGPVDVLAVLQYHAIGLRDAPWLTRKQAGQVADELARASAAVADLIEAIKEFRAGIAALVICEERSAPQDICDAVAEKFQKAADRLDAALARVSGAS